MKHRSPLSTIFSFLLVLSSLLSLKSEAQLLKPGFVKSEYLDLMKMSARFGDSSYVHDIPPPDQYTFLYRSRVVGLENRWDLWGHKTDRIAVISLRGTTQNSVSWLANFYAAMVPAKGEMQLSENEKFSYELATHPRAAVHVGWLVSTAFLAKDILPKIDSLYKNGTKDFYIMGHSQGGAIGFLMTAYLYSLQRQGRIPVDIQFKTYLSASPKPGNLYFAYDYESRVQSGWSYNVVNASDWVPEVPLTVQTVNDFNPTNPFHNAKGMIRKQKFLQRIVLNRVYKDLSKPSLRAQKNYQKYLGKFASKTVAKNLNGYVAPEYYNSSNYVRTGFTIVLYGDSTYAKKYPDSDSYAFVHHLHPPYLYLANLLTVGTTEMTNTSSLNGSWEVKYVAQPGTNFDSLYPDKKPFLTFDNDRVSGYSGCNSFSGPVRISGNTIRFSDAMAMTKMFCPGDGEKVFLDLLRKVNRYALNADQTLTLLTGDVAVMRLVKK